jgi:hypothetical protein
MVTRLYQLVVFSWEHGAYDQVSWSMEDERFVLNGKMAQGLITARLLTTKTDELSTKVLAQDKKPAPGEYTFDNGRFPLSLSGPLIHLIELELPGQGRFDKTYHVNSQWIDANSYEGTHQLMPIVATTIRILENMFVRKLSDPVDRLMKLYRETLPLPSAFNEQVEALRKHFKKCHLLLAFADFAANVYPDGENFSHKMTAAKNIDACKVMVAEMRELGGETAFAVYQEALEKVKYEPYDLEGFEKTSPDFSAVQIKDMKSIQDTVWEALDLAI